MKANDFLDDKKPTASSFLDSDQPTGFKTKSLAELLSTYGQPDTLNEGAKVVSGLPGVLEVGARRGYAGIGKVEQGALSILGDLLNSEALRGASDVVGNRARQIENSAVLQGKRFTGFAPESIVNDLPEAGANAVSSVIQTAPSLLAGASLPGAALPALFGQTFSQEYAQGKDAGLTPLKAAGRAVPMAAFEVAGEKLGGLDSLAAGLRKATAGNGVADLGSAMLSSALKEIPSEEFTTAGQFLTDKAPVIGINQDATLADYGQQVKDTALATALQSGAMGASGRILQGRSAPGQSVMSGMDQTQEVQPAQQINPDAIVSAISQATSNVKPSAAAFLDSDTTEAPNVSQPAQQSVAGVDTATIGLQPDNGAGSPATELSQPNTNAGSDSAVPNGALPASNISDGALPAQQPSDLAQATNKESLPVAPVVNDSLTTQRGKKPKANTLLSAIDGLGGIDNKYKWDISGEQKFARGGYNKVFRNASTKTLEQHIENGDLDEFLPYDMRSTVTDDPTAGRDYLADRIRNGDRVLPYDVELEAKQSRAYEQFNPQDDISAIGEDIDLDEINRLLSEAGYVERETAADNASPASTGQIENTQPKSTNSNVDGGQRTQGSDARETATQNEVAGTPGSNEREGTRQQVETIVKRRAAANQIGKSKPFDNALKLAKDFMNGEDVSPTKFKNAAIMFASDKPLSEAFTALAEMAKAPARENRQSARSAMDVFTEQINNAKTVDELKSISRNIQIETGVVSDAMAQQLDDMVMARIDALDNGGDLLGDNTAQQQAVADAERAKDAKRNAGDGNASDFVLTGSTRPADEAAARGAQDLFGQTAQAAQSDQLPDATKIVEQVSQEPAAEEVAQTETTPLSQYESVISAFQNGTAKVDDYKKAFDYVVNNEQTITDYLNDNFTKPQLLERFNVERYKAEPKARMVSAAYGDIVRDFLLPKENGMITSSYSFGGGDKYSDIKRQVGEITQESLDAAMQRRLERVKQNEAQRAERLKGMGDPKTLDDFTNYMRSKTAEGMTFQQARMTLTSQQRVVYDELVASYNRDARKDRVNTQKTQVQATASTTSGQVVETKHTKTGETLFVVKVADRVDREVYNQWNTTAKRMGGYYSSFRGAGAVPGFQFKSMENAQAFLQYLGGDTEQAKEAIQAKRDAYADDRSQTAVERLTEMADRLEQAANEQLGRDRKVNTARRAGMAARAEAAAEADKAMAVTMRNIATAIQSGNARYLDQVRQKTQVELLQRMVNDAHYKQGMEKYKSYAEYEKHRYDPADMETSDYAEFPSYTLFRSDWARLGRAMVETDGLKQLGAKILSTADDVTDAYIKFAKENIAKVGTYMNSNGLPAMFSSKGLAEEAIARSGYNGKAIPLQIKRGQYQIVESPGAAMEKGTWKGDSDARITLGADFVNEVVEKIGKANRRANKVEMPWQLESIYDRRMKLKRMNIETPAEMRAALREFIDLQQIAKAPDKVKELERSMIGRRNDGLDFFPTPADTADTMIDVAEIKDGMTILEPSAGMAHIADRIRAAGFEPDVAELSGDRRDLLEAKGYNIVGTDFLAMTGSYDRIIMNPPFSDRRDMEHVQHAYNMLNPGGRLVAIAGEGVFFGSDKKATGFREWLDSVSGTSEKLEEGTFNDTNLPVNTSANARMIVVNKPTDGETPLFKRDPMLDAIAGIKQQQKQIVDDVQSYVDQVTEGWKNAPVINVVYDLYDTKVPQEIRDLNEEQEQGGATGTPSAFIYKSRVYVVASQMSSAQDVLSAIFHESLGHYGLRGVFQGKQAISAALSRVATMRSADVAKKAKQYGLDISKEADRLLAAEEVLAELAETRPEIGVVKQIIAAIRSWLRDNVPYFRNIELSDAEIIRDYILPARRFVENGGQEQTAGDVVAAFDRQTFQRKESDQPKRSMIRDELGRFKSPTGIIYDKTADIVQILANKIAFGTAPKELRTITRLYKADIQKAMEAASNVVESMSPMSQLDRALVSDVVEKMVATGVTPPEHIVKIATGIQNAMDMQTDELVNLGMLSQDSADRWRGKYLPRFYMKEKTEGINAWVGRMLRNSLPVRGIGGNSLKGRGLFEEVNVNEVPKFEALGWEVRDPLWKKNRKGELELVDENKVVTPEKVVVWRDWTPSERAEMGENRDALFRFVMGYTSMQNDIALGRLFDLIAKNQEWARARASDGYVKVPDSEIPETNGVKRYGNLAGLYVKKEILDHISQYEESSELWKYYRKALSFWKAGKTVLNPVAHVNNVVSNLTMAHFAGVSYWDVPKYVAAIKDLASNAPMVQEAKDRGLMTGDITRAELMADMPDDIKAMMEMQESQIKKSAKTVFNALTLWIPHLASKPMGKAYRFEDDFFKYLIYRDARKNGLSPDNAVDYATKYIFTYDDLPKGARTVRDLAIPFFAYTYKAVPALTHTLLNYPWRFAAPAAAVWGANAIAFALAAGDDGDDWQTMYEKGKDLEEEERKNLPPWMQGRSALGASKSIRLGTDEKTQLPVYMDVSRMIPGGDIFDVTNQADGVPVPAPIMPSNPVLTTIAAMFWNKDTFTGKEVVDLNDTGSEAAKKRAEWLLKQLSPGVAPTAYHFDRLAESTALMSDKTVETPWKDYTGYGRDGLPVQGKYAVGQTFGIKARPIDLERSAEISDGQDNKEISSIIAEMDQAERLLDQKAISQREYDRRVSEAETKIEAIENK